MYLFIYLFFNINPHSFIVQMKW